MPQQHGFQPGPFTFEVNRLVEAGLAVEPNQVWTYQAMANVAGSEIDGSSSSLQEALKRLARDHGAEFKNIRKIGYVRLDDTGIVSQGANDRQGIQRRLSRAAQRTKNIRDWQSLNDHLKRELDTHRSIVGVMRQLLKPASVRRVREEVGRAHDHLDVERTLQLFRPAKKD